MFLRARILWLLGGTCVLVAPVPALAQQPISEPPISEPPVWRPAPPVGEDPGFEPADPFTPGEGTEPEHAPGPDGEIANVPAPGSEPPPLLPDFNGPAGTVLADPAAFGRLSPLRRQWFVRQYFLKLGDTERAKQATTRLLDLRRSAGLTNASSLAQALIQEAFTRQKAGDPDGARQSADLAVEMAPDLPAAYWGTARIALKQKRLGDVASALTDAMDATARNDRDRNRILGSLLLVAIAAGCFAAFLFGLATLIRHGRQFVHDLGHALGDRAHRILVGTVSLAVLAIPWILGLGPAVGVLWFLVLFWLYFSTAERVVAVAVGAFIAVLPTALEQASGHVLFATGDSALLYAARDDESTPEIVLGMRSLARNEKDLDAVSTYALLLKRHGEYGEALDLFQKVAEQRPEEWVNVGVVQYALGRIDEANASFTKALASNSSLFAAHYNLAKTNLDVNQATASMNNARALDDLRVTRLEAYAFKGPELKPAWPDSSLVSSSWLNRDLAEHQVSDATLHARAFNPERTSALSTSFWQRYAGGATPQALPIFAIGAGVLALLLLAVARRTQPALPCRQCGKTVCVACDGPPRDDGMCPRCAAAFLGFEGVDPHARKAQELKVERKKKTSRLVRPLIGAVVPGGAHLLAGHTVTGTLLALIAAFFGLRLVAGSWLLPAEYPLAGAGALTFVTCTVAVVAVWFFSFNGARRIEG